ncbi:MAG TPA: hypothetical protein VFT20_10750 [Candidatus Limnocylindrales bacterium]|nr:hypothetical protein [Candidatus Limnocylindrales bacterium]
MSVLRRLVAADEAQETRVFLFMAAFGLVVAAIYWFVSYELAGTVLLAGFGLATGVIGARLVADPASARVRRRSRSRGTSAPDVLGEVGDTIDAPAEGSGEIDRPFVDETGRIPDATLAPFAVGLGLALAATGLVFGPAPVIVGLLPLAWGAWRWLTAAGAELRATHIDERTD